MIKEAKIIKEKFESKGVNYKFVVLYSGNKELTNNSIEAILNAFKISKDDIIISELSAEQVAHMGPNAFGITFKVDFK